MLFLVALFETADVPTLSLSSAAEHAFEIVLDRVLTADALVLIFAALALAELTQHVTIVAAQEVLHDLLVFLLLRELILVLGIVIHTFLQKETEFFGILFLNKDIIFTSLNDNSSFFL